MSHAIHSLHGVLIDDKPYGEAGRILYVFSPDLGIVMLLAQGVREQKSKLRGLLNIGTIGYFEFVEGKEVKRLTTIVPEKKFVNLFKEIEKRSVFSRTVNFLERVVVGEQENIELYNKFIRGLEILENIENKNEVQILEIALIINMLHALGYWSEEGYSDLTEIVFEKIKANKDDLIKQINKSINSTHL